MPWDAKCQVPTTSGNVATISCITSLFQNIINAFLVFAGVVALVILILAGITYIRGGNDPKQLEGARQAITYGLIGLFLVLLSFLIINLIGYITGVTCITNFGFTNCQ